MAGVLIGLIILFLFFFILTREVWIKVIKEEKLKIQLHFPLLSLHLISEDSSQQNEKKSKRLSRRAYMRITSDMLSRIGKCEIFIKRIILPCSINSFDGMTLVRPFGYQGLIYAAIAYLKTKTQRLFLDDNAIISSPDVTSAQYYITARLRLYQLIYALFSLKHGINEEKERMKRNVGK